MTPELFNLYVNVLSAIALVMVPASLFATYKGYRFARKYWPFKLPTVLFIVNLIALPVSFLVAYLSFARLTGRDQAPEALALTPLAFIILLTVPFITTGYLIWLERKSSGNPGVIERRSSDGEQ